MIKRTVTYEDLNGNQVTEDLYFHLTKAELLDIAMNGFPGYEGKDFQAVVDEVVASEDASNILKMFKTLVQLSYGEKSEDGRRFIKDEKKTDAFLSSPAYSEFVFDMLTSDNENAGANFVNGLIPQGVIPDNPKASLQGQNRQQRRRNQQNNRNRHNNN